MSTETAIFLPYEPVSEEEQMRRGEYLVKMLNLKEAKQQVSPTSRRLRSYDPPRYYTQWGTKNALGVFRSVEQVVQSGIPD